MPSKAVSQPLAKGQVWKLTDRYIEIVHIGKLLAQYKETRTPSQRGAATQFKQIAELEKALVKTKAKLIKKGTPAPEAEPTTKSKSKAKA